MKQAEYFTPPSVIQYLATQKRVAKVGRWLSWLYKQGKL